MIFARDEQGNAIEATPGARTTCHACGRTLIARCGEIYVNHWAHESGSSCDDWTEPDTDWHLEWKQALPKEWVDQVVERDGSRRFVDALLPDGTGVLFRRRRPSPEETRKREAFFGAENVIWVFDTRDAKSRFVGVKERDKSNEFEFRWRHARKSVAYPEGYIYLDFGPRLLMLKGMQVKPPFWGYGQRFERDRFIRWLRNGAERGRIARSHIIGELPKTAGQ